ncbi:MAG TPA: cupin domain-containing protein [Frateuria sp.]|uniref:cupin domain-containing protein n=1 Tax=Frateuria sp. TaxID=2211372 RepID=UPI002D7F74FC|nr:cupin domain-containing protein [Frateuria sp.]HET6803937.1 cupin domain-containing protein [Frateuria sp.]
MKISPSRSAVLLAGIALGLVGPAFAHEPRAQEAIMPVMQQAIPELPGKVVRMVVVSYKPGQSSDAHMHPGSVFAYVAQGSVVSQLEGQPPRTYRQGEGWYETPGVHHLVSRNASTTEPATLLVWAISGLNQPVKLPLPASGATPLAQLPVVGH